MKEEKITKKYNTQIQSIQKITEPNLYQSKGQGKIIAYLIIISFFYFTPDIGKIVWPKNLSLEYPRMFNFLSIIIVHHIIFIICNFFYYIVYIIENPFFEKYRIHNEEWPWKKDKESWNKLLKETFFYLFINQFIMTPIASSIVFLREKPNLKYEYNDLPNKYEFIFHIIFLILSEDFFFIGHIEFCISIRYILTFTKFIIDTQM